MGFVRSAIFEGSHNCQVLFSHSSVRLFGCNNFALSKLAHIRGLETPKLVLGEFIKKQQAHGK